jgi:hypothetical protein
LLFSTLLQVHFSISDERERESFKTCKNATSLSKVVVKKV